MTGLFALFFLLAFMGTLAKLLGCESQALTDRGFLALPGIAAASLGCLR